nr:hypothetical protein CFP56_21342 [Quercus suber]
MIVNGSRLRLLHGPVAYILMHCDTQTQQSRSSSVSSIVDAHSWKLIALCCTESEHLRSGGALKSRQAISNGRESGDRLCFLAMIALKLMSRKL